MASFDRSENDRSSEVVTKYPIRRLEPSIQKFIKVLGIDLDRLHRHGINMQKMINIEDWVGLNKEQINASRTIQQIKANIREIEKARKQTCDEDVKKFDERVEEMKEKAVLAVQEFIISEPDHSSLHRAKQERGDRSPTRLLSKAEITDHTMSLPASTGQFQLQQELHIVPQNCEAAASWETLQESLGELNELVQDFAQMVDSQGEKIDNIESNIDNAAVHVHEGTKSLGSAAKFKAVAFPLTGAIIGGIAGGPIGLFAGMKLGLAAAGVGGVVGFASGRLLKNRQDKIVELEMRQLSEQRSTSLPELSETSNQNSFSKFFNWFPESSQNSGSNSESESKKIRHISESNT